MPRHPRTFRTGVDTDPRLADWLTWGRRQRRWADATTYNYHRYARMWLDYCHDHSIRPTRSTRLHVSDWLDTLHPSPGVRAQGHTALRAWFAYQCQQGHAIHDPAAELPKVPARRSVPRSLERDTVRRVLHVAASHGPMWGCYIALLAYAGLRRAEACGLRWADVEGADAWLRILGKGQQERVVPIHDQLRPFLVRWRTATTNPVYLFPGRWGDAPMDVSTASKKVRVILDAAGVREATSHWLRHSFGRRLIELGVPLPEVMEAMGHASLGSTTTYLRARPAQVAAAIARLDY